MDGILFFKAALIGLSIAAPVGPIGLLCIQRTLAHGARTGFLSGLGAAAADAVYGAVGAFGLSAVMQMFLAAAVPLSLAGALFLGWMGVQLWRAVPPAAAASVADPAGAWQAFGSVFLLTLANPMTILSFVAVFAAIGGTAAPDASAAGLMVLGVFAGSALWWLTMAVGVALLRHRIGARVQQAINRGAAVLLLAFAGWQLIRLLIA